MTNTKLLLALAERCEREEPCRELNVAIGIACAIGGYEWAFTTSLDAAVTLVPEKMGWSLDCPRTVPSTAWLPAPLDIMTKARTPALALCAAALKARAAAGRP